MTQEEWKPITWIPNLPPDKYSISSCGRIRNNYTNKIRKNVLRPHGVVACLVSSAPRTHKRMVHYSILPSDEFKKPKSILLTIPIQVAKAFLPEPDPDPDMIPYVIHLDGNVENNNVSNIRWRFRVSSKYVREHKVTNNRKLNEADVRKVCEMLIEEKGKLRKVKERLPIELPHVTIKQVADIKYKEHFANISNEYFFFENRRFKVVK